MARPQRLQPVVDEATGKLFRPLDATRERLAMAANDNEVTKDGGRRLCDWPLARLAARRALDSDADTNKALYQAGERYAEDVYLSGLDAAPASPDYARPIVDGGGSSGVSWSEMRLRKIDAVRGADKALGPKYRALVFAVCVARESDMVELGRKASGLSGRQQAHTAANERLSAGLYILARHYQLL